MRVSKLGLLAACAVSLIGGASRAQDLKWQSIAYGASTQRLGQSVGMATRDDAIAAAMSRCSETGARDCSLAVASRRCISLALAGAGGPFGAAGDTPEAAKIAAKAGCSTTWGGACTVKQTVCPP